jgi:hypothetical protein
VRTRQEEVEDDEVMGEEEDIGAELGPPVHCAV